MIVTVEDIIHDALTMLQVHSPDVNLTGDEETQALRILNGLVESLSNNNQLINAVTTEDFTLIARQGTYTWGTGGDFNSTRPITVKAMTVAISGSAGNIDMPVSLIQYDDWAAIRLKSLQTNYPQYAYIDGAYPLLYVRFYPVPSSAIPVTIYSYKSIAEFTSLTQALELPQGYFRMLVANLAVELAPSYQLTASANIIKIAEESRRALQATNYRPLTMQTDAALMGGKGRYNIFNDKTGAGR